MWWRCHSITYLHPTAYSYAYPRGYPHVYAYSYTDASAYGYAFTSYCDALTEADPDTGSDGSTLRLFV